MERVPGTPGPQVQQMQIPVVELAGCQVRYEQGPNGMVLMLVGPVMLSLPFSQESAKVQADKLRQAASGVQVPIIVPPGV